MNSKAMQVKVQREKESSNGTMKENRNMHMTQSLLFFLFFDALIKIYGQRGSILLEINILMTWLMDSVRWILILKHWKMLEMI